MKYQVKKHFSCFIHLLRALSDLLSCGHLVPPPGSNRVNREQLSESDVISVSALEIKTLKRLDIFQVILTYVVSLQTVWYDLFLHSG